MGLTGELVRSVFSKSRSVGAHDSNMRSYGVDRRRWSSVRTYLCGDKFNSVLAEKDSASIQSFEATVSQLVAGDLKHEVEIQSEEKEEQIPQEKQNTLTELLSMEDATIVIQSAFRGFLARHRDRRTKQMGTRESIHGMESPSRESLGPSIKIQTGNSLGAPTIIEESMAVPHRVQQKALTQVYKQKEDWDDSTVSSNISKLRIQNKLEAVTRRERALAYAFSQQLRICSKKKSTQSDTTEPNMGWSWLERWMATRQTESPLIKDHMSKLLNSDRRSMVIKKTFDVVGEEKERCGSNEVPVRNDNFMVTAQTMDDRHRPINNRQTATSVSRRKTMPRYQYPSQLTKVSNKDCLREARKDRKPGSTRDMKFHTS